MVVATTAADPGENAEPQREGAVNNTPMIPIENMQQAEKQHPSSAPSSPPSQKQQQQQQQQHHHRKKQQQQQQQHQKKNRRLPPDAKIAIVGSGLAGLSCAIALRDADFSNLRVYDRDPSEKTTKKGKKSGYGLTLSYNPKGPLAKLGLLEEFARRDVPSRSHYVFDKCGGVAGYYGNAFLDGGRGLGQRGNLRVKREDVRKVMLEKVGFEAAAAGGDDDGGGGGGERTKPVFFWEKKLVRMTERRERDGDNGDDDGGIKAGDGGRAVTLFFDDGSCDTCDLVIGADGIRSTARTLLMGTDNTDDASSSSSLSYLGIVLIIGISPLKHPLLSERGFYTLDDGHRLFTMPYSKTETMWQLSFRFDATETDARNFIKRKDPPALKHEVLRRIRGWHDPVEAMVTSTPPETIWGTALADLVPKPLHTNKDDDGARAFRRVVLVGDAAHPMSPFKGQGANQALTDGPALVDWLRKASLPSALRGFEREMVARTKAKVLASREAARLLHSEDVLSGAAKDFAGVRKECVGEFIRCLESCNVTASLGSELDGTVRHLIAKTGVGVVSSVASTVNTTRASNCLPPSTSLDGTNNNDEEDDKKVLVYAATGQIEKMRHQSLTNATCIRNAKDERGRNCLILSALHGHYYLSKWLLEEVKIPCHYLDNDGRSALHAAVLGGSASLVQLLVGHFCCNSDGCVGQDVCWARDVNGDTPVSLVGKGAKRDCGCDDDDERIMSLLLTLQA